MAIGRLNIGLTGVQPGGLAKVIPSSVAVGSGSGSVDSNGKITFSGANSVSINNVFSTTYENYKVLINYTNSTNGNSFLRMRTTSDDTGSVYDNQRGTFESSSAFALRQLNQTAMAISWPSNSIYTATIEVFAPNLAAETKVIVNNIELNSGSPNASMATSRIETTTQYAGITFSVDAGSMTGTISVYGYN